MWWSTLGRLRSTRHRVYMHSPKTGHCCCAHRAPWVASPSHSKESYLHQRKLYRVTTTTHASSAKVTTTTRIRCKGQGHQEQHNQHQCNSKQEEATDQIRTCNQCDLSKGCRPIVPLQLALMLILLLPSFAPYACGGWPWYFAYVW